MNGILKFNPGAMILLNLPNTVTTPTVPCCIDTKDKNSISMRMTGKMIIACIVKRIWIEDTNSMIMIVDNYLFVNPFALNMIEVCINQYVVNDKFTIH